MTNRESSASHRMLCLALLLAVGLRMGPGFAQPPRGSGQLSATDAPEAPAAQIEPDAVPEADVVHLTNGNSVEGYVAEDSDTQVVLISELRRGSFTRATFRRSQVARVTYAPEAARAAMAERIAWWEEKDARDAAAANAIPVIESPTHAGTWEATGPYVKVVCDVDPGTTREMAFRMNSMYEEWLKLFGRARTRGNTPTTMYVVNNLAAYREIIAQVGDSAAMVNLTAGFYVPPPVDITVIPLRYSDARATKAALQDYERAYAGQLDPHAWSRYKRHVKSRLGTQRARQIATAYHESMHAFMAKELFPAETILPTWLNEGMASYVEMLREDVNGLRVHVVNPHLYPLASAALEKNELPSIRDLVNRRESVSAHDTRETVGAAYAASWALIYFLNTERNALENHMYARYVAALEGGAATVDAFETMTGEPLGQTEMAWRRAIPTWK